jgi:hypothetical protein
LKLACTCSIWRYPSASIRIDAACDPLVRFALAPAP